MSASGGAADGTPGFAGEPEELLALRRREQELEHTLENSGVGLHWLAPDGRIVWANRTELEVLGYSPDEYVGHDIREFYPDDHTAAGILSRLAAGEALRNYEARVRSKRGRIRHQLINSNILLRSAGGVYTRCFTHDVTDRVAADEAVRRGEERYRAFIHNSSEGIWRFELDRPIDSSWSEDEQVGRIYEWAYLAECNDAMSRMYGHDSSASLLGARLSDLFVLDDPKNEAFLRAFISSGYRLRDAESHERDLHGDDRYFENSLIGVIENGMLVRAWGTQRDITRQRRVEGALRESEERFARFMKQLPGAAWIKTLNGRYVYANPEAERIFGRRLEDLRGRSDFEVFPRDTAIEFTQNDQRALEYPAGLQTVEILAHDDGPHESLVSKFPILDERGTPVLVGGIAIDITEQRRAQAALTESRERLRLAADAGNVGLWDWDIQSNRVVWSDTVYEVHGLERGSFGGTVEDFAALNHGDDMDRVKSALSHALEAREPYQIEFRTIRPDGQIRWLSTTARVLYDDRGQPVRMLGAVLDMTERRDHEERLRRSNEELQEFAFVASHALREPLRMVNAYTELLLRRAAGIEAPDVQIYRQHIQRGVRRMEELIHDLLAYSRVIHGESQEGVADLQRALDKALRVLQTELAESSAEISADNLPVVGGGEAQFEQVFQNLISNSVKYRDTERRLRIRIAATHEGQQLRISIRDNGIGFDPQYGEHIFGLFKRLQHGYPGTGLGLAICKRIIERCGGTIWAESTSGVGSTFSFTLPQVPAAPAVPDPLP
jgi:PAS domain S-box-containing protein